MSGWSHDPVVAEFREQISVLDRSLLETVNRRIELVVRLREYKAEQGYPLLDRAREDAIIAELGRVNPGPLSQDGLHDLFTGLLDLVKREIALGETPAENG